MKLPPDRVYGYQVEIARVEGGNSGNIYDEARRARFLDDFTQQARSAQGIQGQRVEPLPYRVPRRLGSGPGLTASPAPTSATR